MTEKEALQAKIEEYLANSMDADAKAAFEQRLSEDPALREALELNREVNLALKNPLALKLENDLKGIGEKFSTEYQQKEVVKQKSKRLALYKWSAVAAVVLLGLFGWLWSNQNAPSNDTLFATFYEAYPVTNQIRSAKTPLETDFRKAQEQYQRGDYANTIQSIDQLLERDSLIREDRIELHFYKGIAHLGIAEYGSAQHQLQLVKVDTKNAYLQQALWYLALIALKVDSRGAAVSFLVDLQKSGSQGKYVLKAKELLVALERPELVE